MDSKLNLDSRMADLDLSTTVITAAVQDIPGASIDSGNVELDLTKFAASGEASVVLAEVPSAGEVATVTVASDVATLDFTSAVSASDVVRVTIKRSL